MSSWKCRANVTGRACRTRPIAACLCDAKFFSSWCDRQAGVPRRQSRSGREIALEFLNRADKRESLLFDKDEAHILPAKM